MDGTPRDRRYMLTRTRRTVPVPRSHNSARERRGNMRCVDPGGLSVVKGTSGALETLPLPDDPALASWASALGDAGH